VQDLVGVAVRVSIFYLYALAVLRSTGKRGIGAISAHDFVVAVMLGDLFDDVIWGEIALAKGLVGFTTVVLVHLLVSYGCYKSRRFTRLVQSPPTVVIREGRVVDEALRRERMRREELAAALRLEGVEHVDEVLLARVEPSGDVSVLLREEYKPAEKRWLRLLRGLLG